MNRRVTKASSRKAKLRRWPRRAQELGAESAKIISAESVITGAWVRLKCQYGCGGYGQSLTCPPHSPTPEQTRQALDCYQAALLVHSHDGRRLNKIVVELEREIFLAGFRKALAFGAGPCALCKECDLEGCLHPDRARPSMEAAGMDVFSTARGNGYRIEVLTDPGQQADYFGLVLIE